MAKTLVVSKSEVSKVFTLEDCIPLMGEALKQVSNKRAVSLERVMIPQQKGNKLAQMMSSLPETGICGNKTIVFPGQEAMKNKTSQGFVSVFDSKTGALLALVDAKSITHIRTAATSGFATDILANKEAEHLAILGTGNQGGWHTKAILKVRDIKKITLWNRTKERALSFKETWKIPDDIEIVVCDTAREAVRSADIICTTTKGNEIVLEGAWLKEGAHVNAVGCCTAVGREVDSKTLVRARVFTDQTQSCEKDAGDIIGAEKLGEYSFSQVEGELGQVLLGDLKGRKSKGEITLFESVGIAVEDLMSAYLIYLKAKEKGIGTLIELSE